MPDLSARGSTDEVIHNLEAIAARVPGVKNTVAISGQSLLLNANAPNFGSIYVMLDEFHDRAVRGQTADAISQQMQEEFRNPRRLLAERIDNAQPPPEAGITKKDRSDLLDEMVAQIGNANISIFGAPPVEGLGTAGGFKIVIEDRGDLGMTDLQAVSSRVVAEGDNTPGLNGLFASFRADTPWLYLDVDRREAKTMGVSIAEVFNALQIDFGSLYVNDFNRFGRTWQVTLQADAQFRSKIDGMKQLKIRNDKGNMVPLMAFSKVRETKGPLMVVRYNMYGASMVNGSPAQGTSSGQAIELMEKLTNEARDKLAPSMRAEWTEIALLQLQAGNTAMLAFLLAVVLVFLVLAAQYESWALPLAVILVVPMCLLCAIVGVRIGGQDVNIFTQIGFVVLVGLACKNAILIVEFAKQRREAGASRRDATLEACQLHCARL